ncbi:MAG TPA: hypothetical protein VFA47_07360 [Candidatus Manganitrophaceae bacterium]|nr:hypothetical protein [Candidatus Manganitrophaceae bacterium]
MDKKIAYQEKMDAQLREWSAKIDQLKAKADKAKAEAKIEYYDQIEALKAKQKVVQAELQKLKASGEEAWEKVRTGVENAWGEMKSAVEGVAARLK